MGGLLCFPVMNSDGVYPSSDCALRGMMYIGLVFISYAIAKKLSQTEL